MHKKNIVQCSGTTKKGQENKKKYIVNTRHVDLSCTHRTGIAFVCVSSQRGQGQPKPGDLI